MTAEQKLRFLKDLDARCEAANKLWRQPETTKLQLARDWGLRRAVLAREGIFTDTKELETRP